MWPPVGDRSSQRQLEKPGSRELPHPRQGLLEPERTGSQPGRGRGRGRTPPPTRQHPHWTGLAHAWRVRWAPSPSLRVTYLQKTKHEGGHLRTPPVPGRGQGSNTEQASGWGQRAKGECLLAHSPALLGQNPSKPLPTAPCRCLAWPPTTLLPTHTGPAPSSARPVLPAARPPRQATGTLLSQAALPANPAHTGQALLPPTGEGASSWGTWGGPQRPAQGQTHSPPPACPVHPPPTHRGPSLISCYREEVPAFEGLRAVTIGRDPRVQWLGWPSSRSPMPLEHPEPLTGGGQSSAGACESLHFHNCNRCSQGCGAAGGSPPPGPRATLPSSEHRWQGRAEGRRRPCPAKAHPQLRRHQGLSRSMRIGTQGHGALSTEQTEQVDQVRSEGRPRHSGPELPLQNFLPLPTHLAQQPWKPPPTPNRGLLGVPEPWSIRTRK